VGALVIKECVNCFTNDTNLPAQSSLQSLPGLAVNLRQFRDFRPQAGFLGSIFLSGTAFVDLRSFANLACPPGQLQLTNNPFLRTMAGWEKVSLAYWKPGASLTVYGNPLFTGPNSLAPASTYLGCNAAANPPTSRPSISMYNSAGAPCYLGVRSLPP
jgi:hypothetical protein